MNIIIIIIIIITTIIIIIIIVVCFCNLYFVIVCMGFNRFTKSELVKNSQLHPRYLESTV